MNIPKIKELFKAGAHFGHRTNRWHPKMKPFIFCSKKGVYVIDLNQTQECLESALTYMQKLVKEEKSILFVGTKNQVKKPMQEAAIACGMPYIVGKWSGGYLTNFVVIKRSIKKYQDLLAQKETGKLDKYNKKERLNIDRELKKMEAKLGGLVNLNKLPDALFVWDIKKEATAIEEALSMKVPVIAIVDTNVNPDLVKYPIPANDDSTKTVKVILAAVVDVIVEARKAVVKKD
ncbi:30S ribosomal protein S2 [Candidatus Falkowbacteria bacterium CG10_big_fil_rev_8_21_14_0_10_39_9]|uniref:Small ribosomal subunit protein uS2 n=1 Tax=Candidatus Falkowbacteria bacterium CG10_big_fil_rev_8_21_14_0_10_39_9 TaxID=1974566 RepID=A0A2M6WR01_9BACT|nr:MAG: 30S ribosomal protein S2 [Candidatus Falkowbacteria bacterium CG10_big_fil_rev_8_21_14_0_10_39_9]